MKTLKLLQMSIHQLEICTAFSRKLTTIAVAALMNCLQNCILVLFILPFFKYAVGDWRNSLRLVYSQLSFLTAKTLVFALLSH